MSMRATGVTTVIMRPENASLSRRCLFCHLKSYSSANLGFSFALFLLSLVTFALETPR